MRLIDADNLRGRVCEIFLCAEPNSAEERRFALVLGLIDSEPTISPPPNEPLTLEKLREMDGEPVWVVELNGYPPRYGLVYWYRKNKRNIVYVTINNGASIDAKKFLFAGGKIYRDKPEEETT